MKSIYLDNAATSHPKPEAVYRAVEETLRRGGSPGRGSHHLAQEADRLIFETRELLADFFNVPDSERFIFTANATTAINQALFGFLRSGDRVVTTSIEHNAVMRPLKALQSLGVRVRKVKADADSGIVDVEQMKQACLEEPTRLLVMNHCSNVFGSLQPVEQLGPWCREQGICFMVDGSQSAGAVPIDVTAAAIDLFAAPGHKNLLGPQGTGFLYSAPNLDLVPLVYGGTGANSHSDDQPELFPERLESGTLNLLGLAGLNAGVTYLKERGMETIRSEAARSVDRLVKGLSDLPGVVVYGPSNSEDRGDAVSFNLSGRDPSDVVSWLDKEKGIAVRGGLHCAPDAHRTIGTYPEGTVRVSPGCLTSAADMTYFLQSVSELLRS